MSMSSKGLPSEAPAWERTSLTDTPPPAPEKERTRGPQRSWGSRVVKCKGVGTKLGVQEFCGARSGTIPTAARSPQGSSSFQKGCLGFHSSPDPDPPQTCAGWESGLVASRSTGSGTRRPHPETSAPTHRLGVILEHLSGLLLGAHLLHALPFQVALLGFLKDLVGAALPGPQELRRFSCPQQHSCREKGVQSTCTHSGVECLGSGFPGTMMPVYLGCSGTVMP